MMTRRTFTGTLAAGALAPAAAARPNIVYILADDLGWGDLGCYNPDSKIQTPNANRLAAQGVRFTDMHSPSSVCTPTRYGILTGRYCWRSRLKSGVLNGRGSNLIEPGRMTVASMLKNQGYYTGGIGKWHLGFQDQEPVDFDKPLKPGPNDHGFDYYFGIPASLDFEPYLFVENDRVVERATKTTPGRNEPRGVFWRQGPIAPGFTMEGCLPTLTDKAVGFLKDRAKKPGQPFFLYFPLTGPHTPWVPLKQFAGKSGAGLYGDFVMQVDDVLGQIMRTLDELNMADNTLLVFTSDNGAHWTPDDRAKYPHRANAHWRGQKADVWDAGHRIPFLARWPGRFKTGTATTQLGCLTDLMSTVSELTASAMPADAGEDSFSWLSAALGTTPRQPMREAVVHHSSQGLFSIRRGEWKLCMGLGSGGFSDPRTAKPGPGEDPGQLYNIAADASETSNVYDRNPAVVASLTSLLDKYKADGRSRPA
jgi:arylsulfatase A-like enzyme